MNVSRLLRMVALSGLMVVGSAAMVRAELPAGRLQTAVKELEVIAKKTLKDTGVPGIAIAIVHDDKVIYAKGFGIREAGKDQPIDADTVFQIASMSKPLSSTVLARLVGEGRITWDDRVIDHDPGFRMYDPYVTRELRLRDLLCHRSGLPDHAGDFLEDLGFDKDQVLRRLRYQPPDSSFRSHYAYNNFGYSEVGYAAAKAAGMDWPALAAKNLFEPLGMKSTSYRNADYVKAKNRALLHVKVDGKWVPKYTRQPDAQAPAGGASSTLNDLAKWVRPQLASGKFEGRELISADALTDTHTPQMVTGFVPEIGRVSSYGLGWNVGVEREGRTFLRHSGEFALGVRTEVCLVPSENLGIVVLWNAAPTGVPEGITESLNDLVIYGKTQRDWVEFANRMFDEEVKKELAQLHDYSHKPAQPTAALKPSAYAGKYANDTFGEIEVAEAGGKLVLKMGPKPMKFDLAHWDRDVFVYQPVGEMAGGLSGVRFSIDADGRAERVVVENLDVNGQGAFSRAK